MKGFRKATRWSGMYRGIAYEILHHGSGLDYAPRGIWCYYLYINEKQIPTEHINKFNYEKNYSERFSQTYYNYADKWLADLPWHCGITYYEKEGGLDGDPLVFKAGCDYNHLGDEGKFYNEEILAIDARATIDALVAAIELNVRCNWKGCYVPLPEAIVFGDGYICKTCVPVRNKAFPNAEPIILESVDE